MAVWWMAVAVLLSLAEGWPVYRWEFTVLVLLAFTVPVGLWRDEVARHRRGGDDR